MTETAIAELRLLDLDSLSLGMPGITPSLGRTHVEACMVRMEDQSHATGLLLRVEGDLGIEDMSLTWQEAVTDQMRRSYNDDEVTTESAAYAISFLLILNKTDYTVIEKSKKGTGFDYWLGYGAEEDIFSSSARLEVSGIRRANSDAEFATRVKQKVAQTTPTDGRNLPAYIAVTDFAVPRTRVVVK